jgi:CRISPR-associated endonuclease Csn1
MSGITLGLDIGSNSIGWALLSLDGNPSIIGAGVRVFQEGVNRDTKGAEISKNETRRMARGARRNRFRRNYRKDKLLRLMKRNGLLPAGEAVNGDIFLLDPYQLRAKGIEEKLSLHEFGRALYHLNQRRGFLSNRKSSKGKDDGIVIKSANELQQKMDAQGARTLGEYFSRIDTTQERIRDHYTFRSMYQKEFDLLWEKQSSFYPEILVPALRQAIADETIFYQRPLKPTDELIGDCTLESDQKRCPRGDWHARRFRILQDVNNLLVCESDGKERKLTESERDIVLNILFTTKEPSFDSLRKKLGLIESQTFNFEEGSLDKKEAKLKGDYFASEMNGKTMLGKKGWEALDTATQIEINDLLLNDDLADEEVAEMLRQQHGFTDEQAQAAIKISFPRGYMSYSRLAIQKLLPHMERGLRTDEAIEAAFSRIHSVQDDGEQVDVLPLPEDLRNPIVNKALIEARKVINAIIRMHGKPSKIVVEMARDVKGNAKEREEMRIKMAQNERENDRARHDLKYNMKIQKPTRDDILKFKLWEECGRECPYTGRPISQQSLFGEHPEFQIEHIIPYSCSLDDSYMNKTLCFVDENRRKGDQTPYAFYNGTEQYEHILQRARRLPYPKRQKFTQKEASLDDFIQRQLNDTRYITREILKYLKQLGCTVTGSRGKVTSELRHQWGLNSILESELPGLKNREDHRHHAIDAVVTALTSQKHLRELAVTKYAVTHDGFPVPWEGFRDAVAEAINKIQVSHRVTRKVSGPLHEETSYGPTGLKDDKGQDVFVYRKKLEALTCAMVEKIVDPVVKEIVKRRLLEFGVDPEKKGSISKDVWAEPLYMKSTKGAKVPIKKVRICDVFNNMIPVSDETGRPYRYVASGNNHHIEIYEYADAKGNIKRDGKVVSMFDAVQRSRQGKLVICRDHGDRKRFVCSLAKNEMFMLEVEEGRHVLHRVQKISSNKQIFFRHHLFAGDLQEEKPISKYPNTLKGYKVTVDPIGRIFPAQD